MNFDNGTAKSNKRQFQIDTNLFEFTFCPVKETEWLIPPEVIPVIVLEYFFIPLETGFCETGCYPANINIKTVPSH